ncbi:hypothetical protein B9Z65_6979 [Elsinoe australis]|uniref:Uncharacterized protein n=1 Tax=Elsinoe australis TaxID=40998 RepID=A0A2P7Z484_9PEZI|nr:hypothetical protein B9Z65_6979 [Elsinoe australis]
MGKGSYHRMKREAIRVADHPQKPKPVTYHAVVTPASNGCLTIAYFTKAELKAMQKKSMVYEATADHIPDYMAKYGGKHERGDDYGARGQEGLVDAHAGPGGQGGRYGATSSTRGSGATGKEAKGDMEGQAVGGAEQGDDEDGDDGKKRKTCDKGEGKDKEDAVEDEGEDGETSDDAEAEGGGNGSQDSNEYAITIDSESGSDADGDNGNAGDMAEGDAGAGAEEM